MIREDRHGSEGDQFYLNMRLPFSQTKLAISYIKRGLKWPIRPLRFLLGKLRSLR